MPQQQWSGIHHLLCSCRSLVCVLYYNILDITLTQGLLDGLIFYANIVWTYQSVLFPKERDTTYIAITFLKTFIAWVNLDFGIETCFVKGLNAYWKTWLQFIFPFYVWAIIGLMVFSARYSRALTRIYGNRAVPVLATLILLSYMKLIWTTTSIQMFLGVLLYPLWSSPCTPTSRCTHSTNIPSATLHSHTPSLSITSKDFSHENLLVDHKLQTFL